MRNEKKICSFFGHKNLYGEDEEIYERLINVIEPLLIDGFSEFLFGGYGEFDSLSLKAINSFKRKYPYISTVYVQAYYYPHKRCFEIAPKPFDATSYPEIEHIPKKFAIIYRNREMINRSDYCIFYVNCGYGGAFSALQYAQRKSKNHINLAEPL